MKNAVLSRALGSLGGAIGLTLSVGCQCTKEASVSNTYGSDLSFLKKHSDVVSLADSSGKAVVAVVPKWQGRVLTSSAQGDAGLSFGWINYEFVEAGKLQQHINVFGGEDRFWMGPEGGQFSIFFKKGVPFSLEHWFTPTSIDTESFDVVKKSASSILMKKETRLENYSGTVFNVLIDREVRVLETGEAAVKLPFTPAKDVSVVAYESINRISNTGRNRWDKDSGMLSIWILGMFNPSPSTTVVLPYISGPEKELGPVVNDAYFGKVPANRLVVGKNVVFFSADGQYRSKIGLSPQRSRAVCGSYDATNKTLTIIQYTKPEGATDYVNSMWELQKEPFKGDVVNSYNDGAPSPGAKPLGPFYELETSSPAAALEPGQSLTHVHRTFHFVGSDISLDKIAIAVLGVSLSEIKGAFAK
ncbi:MAG: DUF6786 family protein [bacterium]